MGREEENRWPWRGQAALARPTPIWASGAALGGQHGGVYLPSGTTGQQPLVFPALARLRGRAAALGERSRAHRAAATAVPCGTTPPRNVPLWVFAVLERSTRSHRMNSPKEGHSGQEKEKTDTT